MSDFIIIIYDNKIHKIEKEPFETDENAYIRGWFIVKNYNNQNYNEIVCNSIKNLNETKYKMVY